MKVPRRLVSNLDTGAGAEAGVDRRLCWALVAAGAVVFVGLAAWLVPWSWLPGGHVRAASPSSVFSAADLRRARAFAGPQRVLALSSLAVSLVVAVVLAGSRGVQLLRRLRGPWWWRVLLGTAVLVVIAAVVSLPFDLVMRQRELQAGLTRQALSGWFRDLAVSTLLNWLFLAVPALLIVGLAHRLPRRWPLGVALVGIVLGVLGSFAYPVVVEPLFNRFTPLPDGSLRREILHLAAVEHVQVSDVLVADASRRTTTLNAYVSGFGSTRRVVVYDTLLRSTPRDETLVVVAHELGHARHQDVVVGTALGAAGTVVGAGLLGLLLPVLSRRIGLRGPGDPAVVALLAALFAVGALVVSPAQNTISRALEARADRASLHATGDTAAFVNLQRRLAVTSLADPTPPAWSQFWFGSHPTALERVGLARGPWRGLESARGCRECVRGGAPKPLHP